ncbi:MAG TPA: sugar transferase [Candidatus Cybelea sp.]|jgi:exopolysaccharide biosynthesis polyprenyl glycosylphosphotransferase|nr:sugar transferase [Candidatus Cybelea sp.]
METLERVAATPSVETLSERSRSIRAFELKRTLVLMGCDVAMLAIASTAAAFVDSYFSDFVDYRGIVESALIWTLASVWTFRAIGLYRISYSLDKRDEWYHVIVGLAIGIAPLLILFTLFPTISSSRLVLLISFVLSVVLVGLGRSVIHTEYGTNAGKRKHRIAIVASHSDLQPLASVMESSSHDIKLVPVFSTEDAIRDAAAGCALWYDQLRRDGCDELVFAGVPSVPAGLMVERAARDHIAVGFAPAGLPQELHGLDFVLSHRQPRLVARRVPACTPINTMFKRYFDIAAAAIGVLLTWPLMALGAVAILIESGRPVIFKQARVGRDGKTFEILKLRTMGIDAEAQCGPTWAVGDPTRDKRATRVGAFLRKASIDELPQFFNVLRGEMSIVGPRPERAVFVERFRKEYPRYDERHLVRPGITGWSHVHMRRSPGIEEMGERLELDLFYIENYSLLLDVFITFKTGVEVLFQRWA